MNDGIVDGIMQRGLVLKVLGGALPETRQAIAKHDEAQREALAKSEAYLECAKGDLKQQERMYWDAQAQLAEALLLIRDAKEGLRTGPNCEWEDRLASQLGDFLARHAQTEQQETREPILVWGGRGGGIDDLVVVEHKEAQSEKNSEFQREERYLVIKCKDLRKVPELARYALHLALAEVREHLPKRKYLVVESDWPEYEPTWAAIHARVEGRAALATQPADERAREMGYRSAINALDDLDRYKMAMSPATAAPEATQQQLNDLNNFFNSVCEGGLHSVEKAGIQSLTELGALENCGFGRHRLTRFGTYLLEQPAVRGVEHE